MLHMYVNTIDLLNESSSRVAVSFGQTRRRRRERERRVFSGFFPSCHIMLLLPVLSNMIGYCFGIYSHDTGTTYTFSS